MSESYPNQWKYKNTKEQKSFCLWKCMSLIYVIMYLYLIEIFLDPQCWNRSHVLLISKRNVLKRRTPRDTRRETYPPTKTEKNHVQNSASHNSLRTHLINEMHKSHGTIHKKKTWSPTKRETKKDFNLYIDKTSSLNIMLFLTFQTIQKMNKGPTLHTFLLSLARKKLLHPKRGCPALRGTLPRKLQKKKRKEHCYPT